MKKMISFLVICLAGILLVTAGFAETAVPKLILSETEVRVAVGKNIQLKAAAENPASGKQGKAAWESSDPEVCTVTASGAVKAVSEGTAVIICTMTFPEGETLSAECRVTTFVAAKQVKRTCPQISGGKVYRHMFMHQSISVFQFHFSDPFCIPRHQHFAISLSPMFFPCESEYQLSGLVCSP